MWDLNIILKGLKFLIKKRNYIKRFNAMLAIFLMMSSMIVIPKISSRILTLKNCSMRRIKRLNPLTKKWYIKRRSYNPIRALL